MRRLVLPGEAPHLIDELLLFGVVLPCDGLQLRRGLLQGLVGELGAVLACFKHGVLHALQLRPHLLLLCLQEVEKLCPNSGSDSALRLHVEITDLSKAEDPRKRPKISVVKKHTFALIDE